MTADLEGSQTFRAIGFGLTKNGATRIGKHV
jgi:hypothetical protein